MRNVSKGKTLHRNCSISHRFTIVIVLSLFYSFIMVQLLQHTENSTDVTTLRQDPCLTNVEVSMPQISHLNSILILTH